MTRQQSKRKRDGFKRRHLRKELIIKTPSPALIRSKKRELLYKQEKKEIRDVLKEG